jgi:hypothetical protein
MLSSEALEDLTLESARATSVKYEPTLIPGLLQTREYADALLRRLDGEVEDAPVRTVNVSNQRHDLPEKFVRQVVSLVAEAVALDLSAEEIHQTVDDLLNHIIRRGILAAKELRRRTSSQAPPLVLGYDGPPPRPPLPLLPRKPRGPNTADGLSPVRLREVA